MSDGSVFLRRKAQSGSNAAIMMIIIMVVIVLYILFLPPNERAELLGDGTIGGSGGPGTGKTVTTNLLREQVGQLDYIAKDEKTYELPAFTVSTETTGKAISSKSSLYAKNSVFDDTSARMTFNADPGLTDNLILSFNVQRAAGRLIIQLNGETIFNQVLAEGSSPPIYLDTGMLDEQNELTFSVSSPGIAFWRFNEYSMTNIKVTADVKDITLSTSTQLVTLTQEEIDNLEDAKLSYIPVCTETSITGFNVNVNGEDLFRGVPDCGAFNYVPLARTTLASGQNRITFSVEQGRVLVDRLKLTNRLQDPVYKTYYFQLDEDKYFSRTSKESICGEIDGVCPLGCEEDEDKDCCFERDVNFWCDIGTSNDADRCVSFVNSCNTCKSGYEDSTGDPPQKCERTCGDDTDDYCPSSCSIQYDADCCFARDEQNFWCDDDPTSNAADQCEAGVEDNECDLCPDGWQDVDGNDADCRLIDDPDDFEENLNSAYDIDLEFTFPNTDQKRFEVFINGRKIGINTAKNTYVRNIDEYVRSGTNSIELRPLEDMTITEIRVKLKQVK